MEALERKIELEASSAIARHNSRLSDGIFDAAAELRPQVVFHGNFQPGADAKSKSEAAAELAAWGPRAKEYWAKELAEERHESLRAHHARDQAELRSDASAAHPSDVARLTSSASARLASRANRQQMLADGSPVPRHADAPPAPAAQAVRTKADAMAALAVKHEHDVAAFEANHAPKAIASPPAAQAAPAMVAAAPAVMAAAAPKVPSAVPAAGAVPRVVVPKALVAAAAKVALAAPPSSSAATPPSTTAATPSASSAGAAATGAGAAAAAEALAKEKVHEAAVELRLRQEQVAPESEREGGCFL